MFEKGIITEHDESVSANAHTSVGDSDADHAPLAAAPGSEEPGVSARTNEALRAIDWSELTARLNAARDLRRELRNDAMLCAGSSGASFGDAAASYFKSLGNDERGINPDSLEASKASCDIPSERSGDAVEGDARDNT